LPFTVVAVLISAMSDREQENREKVWQIIQRGLPPDPVAGRMPMRPAEIMKPERFIIRALMRKVEFTGEETPVAFEGTFRVS